MEVQLRIAGPYLRLIAWAIDLAVTVGILFLLGVFALGISTKVGTNVGYGIWMLSYFVVFWFYPVLFEAGDKGATLGKRATGLRVVNELGTQITMGQAMVRSFVRGVELVFPFFPLVVFFHPRFQRLGDLAAGTLVVYAKPRVHSGAVVPPALSVIPVNQALSREEQAAILSFRDRSVGWSEARREELVDYLFPLTGERGPKGVSQILGMAQWLEDRR